MTKMGTAFHCRNKGGSLPMDGRVNVAVSEDDLKLIKRYFDLTKMSKRQILHEIILSWFNERVSSET